MHISLILGQILILAKKKANTVLGLQKEANPRTFVILHRRKCLYRGSLRRQEERTAGWSHGQNCFYLVRKTTQATKHEGVGTTGEKGYDNYYKRKRLTE